MVVRSLVASIVLTGHLYAGSASAQVLLCPQAPSFEVAAADTPGEAERLLKRLTIALDLHGHRGISEQGIMQEHAETPTALLAKLTSVAERCLTASGDVEGFHDALPGLRKAFLEATEVSGALGDEKVDAGKAGVTKVSEDWTEAERVEDSIDLSVRELWRKLWFRTADKDQLGDERWAVIVASPADADSGWDQLGEHQRRWIDTYFQLHEPYFESNPHHAIVVGRRLPEDQAIRLRDYVIELGMAEDAYLWALPEGDDASARSPAVFEVETEDDSLPQRTELDLTGLN